VDFLSVMLVTGKPDPPKDIKIHVIGDEANISWIIPSNQGVTYSRIYLSHSKEGDLYLSSPRKYKDIPVTTSIFEIAKLKMCSTYSVKIQFLGTSGNSESTTQKFWMTSE
ncbi:Hypothetical predicted protein, partial [Mytilus galloprovincialis]